MNQSSFWQTLAKPLIGLSPMDGVTDHPFRHIQKKYGQPDLIYTEFTSVEGVCHGADRLLDDFLYDESQRPIMGQIYGTTPEYFRQTALILCQLGFDGIDINMGCPAKNVAHSGAGAALIKTPKLAQDIIKATKQGIQDWLDGQTVRDCPDITSHIAEEVERRQTLLPHNNQQRRWLPVSVKTRVGFDTKVVEEWIPNLLEMEVAAIAVHGRTLKQQYGGQADWSEIGKAAALASQTQTLVLGNGDVQNMSDAYEKISTFKLDGVLVGRSSMGNPFVFQQPPRLRSVPTHPSLFEVAIEHCQLFEQTYTSNPKYNFMPMRKHLGWYVREIPNASQIRVEVFQANSTQEVLSIFQKHSLL